MIWPTHEEASNFLLSEIKFQTEKELFRELEIGFTLLSLTAVVEARIEEDATLEVFVDGEAESVFPLNLRLGIVRKVIETASPTHILHQVPSIVHGDIGTTFPLGFVSFGQSEGSGQCVAVNVLEFETDRREVGIDVEFIVFGLGLKRHTDREQRLKGRHEVGIHLLVVGTVSPAKLGPAL